MIRTGEKRRSADPGLRIEYLPIGEVKLDPRNPRVHSKAQVRQIADSIEAFGYGAPILVDKNNVVISGHGRVLACRLMKWNAVPVVRLASLTEPQARGMALAENRLIETSRWDEALLSTHLRELSELDLDFAIEAVGFSVGEIDFRIDRAAKTAAAPSDDELPLPAGPPVSRAGDLWLAGKHRILCGDATEADDYKRLVGSGRAQAVFTDPPYNCPITGHVSGKGKRRHREFAMASGEMGFDDFVCFLKATTGLMTEYTDNGSVHFICMDWRHQLELLVAGQTSYHSLLNLCVWVKPNGGMGSLYRSAHELVTVWKAGAAPHRNNVELGRHGRNRRNVWEYSGFNGLVATEDSDLTREHPTPKPEAMVADALLDVTRRGDRVLDPFLGSAPTLMAAERTGRTCFGIELDPAYVDLAVRRWRRRTGQTAFLEGSGVSFDALEAGGAR